jgi:hypothetical protein
MEQLAQNSNSEEILVGMSVEELNQSLSEKGGLASSSILLSMPPTKKTKGKAERRAA